MCRAQKVVLLVGCLAFITQWLFPPLTAMMHIGDHPPDAYGFRYSAREASTPAKTLLVNERRLFHEQVMLLAIVTIVILAFRPRHTRRD